jgi:UDP-glucose:(heptosyl)LPS alpha-1,3-glucosyltransferase
MAPDRSAHLILVYPAVHRRGGAERVIWEVANHLAPDYRVSVVCGDADDPPPGVKVVTVPGAPFGGLLAPWRFRRRATRVVRGLQPDLTVSFGSNCPAADVLVMQSVHRTWVAQRTPGQVGPVPVPAWIRQVLPRHRIRLVLERSAVRHAARHQLIAVSDNVAADLGRWYGVSPARIAVVPPGFDPAQCSPERSRTIRQEVRSELGLADDSLVLALVANEYHRKGLGTLLEAMADPRVNRPGLRLLLAGRMAPDAYRSEIERLGLGDAVTWIGPVDDIARIYAAADLFVLPTRYEAFGMVIIEALACGLPVVTTIGAGASVAVHAGVNGLLQTDPADAEELAGLLAQALSEGTLVRWQPQCRPAVDGFEWSAVLDRFAQVVVDCLGRSTSPSP